MPAHVFQLKSVLCCLCVVLPCGSWQQSHASARRIFRHHDAAHPISYGVQLPMGRAPFAFASVTSEELVDFLLHDPCTSYLLDDCCDPACLRSQWGFEEDSINEQCENILKADWHASSFWGACSARLFVPRTDEFLPARPAPVRIQAFIQAFQHASAACWGRLAQALHAQECQASGNRELQHSLKVFRRCLEDRTHFTGVEAQIWKGGELTMDSHTDGATAMLHLGVTLGGNRMLRIGKFDERHAPYRPQENRRRGMRSGDEISVWNEAAYAVQELWDMEQSRGCFYVTSPFCFEHGVKYQKHAINTTFALQCRFAFSNLTDARLVNGQRTNVMREIADVIAHSLVDSIDRKELQLPTLQEPLGIITTAAKKPARMIPPLD
ncbi:unnamed protein product [Symbiodinium pilosum]|uniref:Fe2OG dioxygenase domain-containing protein n=1 Tax=Symbiodinium pilosum TaxID=2952 RepID=A0A812IVM4_SYMPI|nr:unnamed protein product [Symbiodinium pilosum]